MARRNGTAVFSPCGLYRYELGGDIGPVPSLFDLPQRVRYILWIMLNPSQANAMDNDQTISTIVAFSELWGFTGLLVGNLYAYKATLPSDLLKAMRAGIDVVGPLNDARLRLMIDKTRATGGIVMAAWGAKAKADRVKAVTAIADGELMCLDTNKDGSPVHPLYQPHSLRPLVWKGMDT